MKDYIFLRLCRLRRIRLLRQRQQRKLPSLDSYRSVNARAVVVSFSQYAMASTKSRRVAGSHVAAVHISQSLLV